MTGIIDVVDATISQARTLLGTGQPATPRPPIAPSGAPQQAQQWNGTAAANASTVSDLLHVTRGQLTDAQTRAIIAMSTGPDIAHTGHTGLDVIEADWQADKDRLGPFSDTPEGQAALITAAMDRLGETQSLVVETSGQYSIAGDAVRQALGDLPDPEEPTAPGDAPAPEDADPTDPDATDLPEDDRPKSPGDAPPDAATLMASSEPDLLHSAAAGQPQAAMMPQAMPMGAGSPMGGMPSGGMPSGGMPAGGGMPQGLQSMLQPLTQAAETLGNGDTAQQGDTDRDRDPSTGAQVVKNADRALGLPYVWGGGNTTGPTGGGFDCSGLAQWAVAQATGGEVMLPRQTYDQIRVGQTIAPGDARPGDLIFSNFSSRGPEHVQIFAGDGRVIEAQQNGVPVKYSNAPSGHIVIKRVT